MNALKNLSKKDLFFLAKKTENDKEAAVKELIRRAQTVEDLHEVFLVSPASIGNICEKLAEKIGHAFAALKARNWSRENPDRLAQMLL